MKKFLMPQINVSKTGARYRVLRKAISISTKTVMKVFNFDTPKVIYNWEEGANASSIDNLLVFSAFFEVTLDELIVKDFKEFIIK